MARTKKNTAPVSTLTATEATRLGRVALLADGGAVALAEITRREAKRAENGQPPLAELIAKNAARKEAKAAKAKGKGKTEATPAAAAAPRQSKKAQIQAALAALIELLG